MTPIFVIRHNGTPHIRITMLHTTNGNSIFLLAIITAYFTAFYPIQQPQNQLVQLSFAKDKLLFQSIM